VQQSLWCQMQMQMQMQIATHVAYHTTTAQVLYTVPSTLYPLGCLRTTRCRIGQTLFCVFALYMHARLFLPLTLIAISL
jgi:hypothetical protein